MDNIDVIHRHIKRLQDFFKDLLDDDELNARLEKAGATLKDIWQGKATITKETINDMRILTRELQSSVNLAEAVAKMPAKDVRPYLQDRINGISIEQYRRDAKESGKPPSVDAFGQYVFCLCASHLEILLLLEKYELTGDFRKWVAAYAMDTYKHKREETTPRAEPEPLPKLPKRPMRHISPNNKLMAALTTDEIINAGAMDLTVMPDDGITTYVMATYTPDEDELSNLEPEERKFIDTVRRLTPFERTVMDAVCSIYKQAEREGDTKPIMTPASIYKAMPGGGEYPKKEMQENIANAYTKMRHIFVKLDASSELLKLKKIKPGEKYTKETNLLFAEEHKYKRQNGTVSIGWQLFQKPVVLDYAEMTGQIVNVPAKVMQIEGVSGTGKPDGLSFKLSENRRELLAYLVRRVAVIKHAQDIAMKMASWKTNREAGKTWQELMKQSPTILYETAFEAAGIENLQNRHTVKDCKDFCRLVFDYWKAIGYIPAYEEVKEGRTARGLKIVL